MDEKKKINYLHDKEARKKHIAEIDSDALLHWLLAFYQRDFAIQYGSLEMEMMWEIKEAVIARMNVVTENEKLREVAKYFYDFQFVDEEEITCCLFCHNPVYDERFDSSHTPECIMTLARQALGEEG